MPARSRSSSSPVDDELRLPRPPGVIRQFWARHPLVTDILVAFVWLLISVGAAPSFAARGTGAPGVAVAATVCVLAGCLLLLLRRSHPLIPFVASFAIAMLFLFAIDPYAVPLLMVTSYSLAVYGSARLAWIGLGAGMGAVALTGLALSATGAVAWDRALNAVVAALVIGLIGTLVGVNIGNRRRYLNAVIARSRQLLVERDQQAQLAAAAERTRIAREMHDIVSHNLTVIVALSEGPAATPDQERSRTAVGHIAETARGALAEMRAMLGVLRDPQGADPVPLVPLAGADVMDAVAAAQRAGFPVSITTTGDPASAPDAVRFATARIVQESLTNAMRHAPAASFVEVAIAYRDDHVALAVDNDGVAAAPPRPSGGFGLQGLRERVGHVGGEVTAGPGTPGHWTVRARIPFTPAPASAAHPSTETADD